MSKITVHLTDGRIINCDGRSIEEVIVLLRAALTSGAQIAKTVHEVDIHRVSFFVPPELDDLMRRQVPVARPPCDCADWGMTGHLTTCAVTKWEAMHIEPFTAANRASFLLGILVSMLEERRETVVAARLMALNKGLFEDRR